MANKVTYGLENVHVAFKGVAQVESITVLTGCGTDGEITVTATGSVLTGSSEACIVPLSTESHSTATAVASAVCDVLNNNADVSANYTATHLAGVIYLTAKVVAADDATLAIAFTPGSTGVTVGSSTAVAAGATGWGTPTAIPGAVGFTPSPKTGESEFKADNGTYYYSTNNDGYTADLEMALIPDSVLATMLGWTIDSNGMLIEVVGGVPTHFALMGQVQGDDKNRRFVYYDCLASRPGKEHKTMGDSVEPATDKLSLRILPIEIDGVNTVRGVMELSSTNATAYNAFFASVTVPA